MMKLLVALVFLLPSLAIAHPAKHHLPKSKDGNLVVGNCDGETSVEVPGKKPGEKLTRKEAFA